MAVIGSDGKKLDLGAIRLKLLQDRDSGRVSNKNYRQSLKGLNTVVDAEKKGIDYQFTAEGRFKTTSNNSQSPTSKEAGVRIGAKLPIMGNQVSKGLGYAQGVKLEVPAEKKAETASAATAIGTATIGSGTTVPASVATASPTIPGTTPAKTGVPVTPVSTPTLPLKSGAPNIDPLNMDEVNKAVDEKLKIGFKPIFHDGDLNGPTPVSKDKPKLTTPPIIFKDNSDGFFDKNKNQEAPKEAKYGTGENQGKTTEKANAYVKNILNSLVDFTSGYNKMRASKPVSSANKNPKLKNGGKIRSFGSGGFGLSAHGIQQTIDEANALAMKRKQAQAVIPSLGIAGGFSSFVPQAAGISKRLNPKPGLPVLNLTKPKAPGVNLINPESGDRQTKGMGGSDKAFNIDGLKPTSKDSLINTALGVYGAASLLTAKKPRLRPPGEFNPSIRPAQGDEDMVARSNQAIDQGVRMGTGMLRSRTGSDLQSYVQGASAMVDSSNQSKAQVLGTNAQLKREDENRMFAEVNQAKQINFGQKEQFRQEQNMGDQQTYQGRVAGAQAAVNNSLNFGVQKRADERSKVAELKQANGRYGTMMLSLGESLLAQGYTPEQVVQKLETISKVSKGQSFKAGGKITSEKLAIGAHQNLAKSSQEMKKILAMYSSFISDASIENIRQFNQNIRAINNRKNITITKR